MNRIAFDQLVASLEDRFMGREAALARNAIFWAVTGYVVLVTALLVSVSLTVLCGVWIVLQPSAASFKIGLVVGLAAGALSFSILRSFWIRMRAPEGRVLKRQDAPELFAMIDAVAAEAGGVNFHKVLLVEELNAAVVQLPMAGIFGLHRNYLLIGLPLMDALPPEEFKAVLAHEFSHLSNKDGKIGNWIYRMRVSWEHTAQHLFQQQGIMTAPLRKFFLWFWPHFNARAFVLSRLNEYRADAFAARVTSPAAASTALCRIQVGARHLDEVFWPGLDRRLVSEPEPPENLFWEMGLFLAKQPESAPALRWLDQAFAVATGTSNTHPSLYDRVKALGGDVTSREIGVPSISASDVLLEKDFRAEVRGTFSAAWRKNILSNWRKAHQSRAESTRQLEILNGSLSDDIDSRWRRLSLMLQSKGQEYALPEVRAFVEAYPEHQEASFLLGRILLEKDDPAGLPLLEKVAARVPSAAINCMSLMAGYFDRHGNHDAVRALKQRADSHDVRMESLEQAASRVEAGDNFLPHGADERMLESVRKVLSSEETIQAAWFMRKGYKDFPDLIQYVLVLDMPAKWYGGMSDQQIGATLQRVADGVELGKPVLVARAQTSKPLMNRVKRMTEALVFQKVS